MGNQKPTNEEIAKVLEHIADLLEIQGANPYRIRSYRDGAKRVRASGQQIAEIVTQGNGEALEKLPDIGEGLARLIDEYVKTGKSNLLNRLQGAVSPEDMFTQVPGIGPELARRIASELDIHTLEELEQAAHDGRLDQVKGFGRERVEAVKVSLAGMLSSAARRRLKQAGKVESKDLEEEKTQPSVETLLAVDAEYRRRARAGELRLIAPKRFNPEGKAWLPILHTEQDGWQFTALYSNTARAHDLGTVSDWVVIYYQRKGLENQVTVVTETQGPLKGKRVVRGRESECQRYYESIKA